MDEDGIKTPENGGAGEKGGFTMTVSLNPFPLHPVGEIEVIAAQHLICYRVSRAEVEALFEHYTKRVYDPWSLRELEKKGEMLFGGSKGEIPARGAGEPQDRVPADLRDRVRVASGL